MTNFLKKLNITLQYNNIALYDYIYFWYLCIHCQDNCDMADQVTLGWPGHPPVVSNHKIIETQANAKGQYSTMGGK